MTRTKALVLTHIRQWLNHKHAAAGPLLYLNGHTLQLSDKEKALLKDYLKKGGLLLAEAYCGDQAFDRRFRDLMDELFPGSKLLQVPAEHPLWQASGKFRSDPKEFPLWGIEQGGKWVVLYSPRPLAGYWEANQHNRGAWTERFPAGGQHHRLCDERGTAAAIGWQIRGYAARPTARQPITAPG